MLKNALLERARRFFVPKINHYVFAPCVTAFVLE